MQMDHHNEALAAKLDGYGVSYTGAVVDHTYHEQVVQTIHTLAEVKAAGGKITRMRFLQEAGRVDVSYIHATLANGTIVPVSLMHAPFSYAIPRRNLKSWIIEWAKAEKVFAKGLGMLDEANWSILN